VAAFIGVILSVFPPLNIAYLIVLMLKNDISEKQVNEI
jgi:F0F1-type ATP synthase assembly protein I